MVVMRSRGIISYIKKFKWILAVFGMLLVGIGSFQLGRMSNDNSDSVTMISSTAVELESMSQDLIPPEETESIEEPQQSSQEPAVEKKPVDPSSDGDLVYSDDNIAISRNGDVIIFRNLTDKKLSVSGAANLNNSKVVDDMSFGYVGDIQPNGVISKDISTVELFDIGEEGDIQGDDFGDRKVFIHKMKDGDVLNWAGILASRETYSIIDEINVDIPY